MDDSIYFAIAVGVPTLLLFAARGRWIMLWFARCRARTRLQGTATSATQSKFSIVFDSNGFFVNEYQPNSQPTCMMAWSEVQRITAFKRDLFVVDCICLAIGAERGSIVEVNEEMEGWQEFAAALPARLPGCRPWHSCFSEVAFPAFATNPTVLYSRQGAISA